MTVSSTGSVNPRRADTRRNHERILVVAAETLTRCGELSFNDIAKRAEVGVGTVYRHFPTSEALILAVYRREVRHLVEVVPELLEKHSPERAFRIWVTDHLASHVMTKHGLANALRLATPAGGDLPANGYDALIVAVTTLLDANVEAGTVRSGIDPGTVLRGLGGLFFLDPAGEWRKHAEDLADLLWLGMFAHDCGKAFPPG